MTRRLTPLPRRAAANRRRASVGGGESAPGGGGLGRLGLKAHATFSGALAWPYFYPWPPHNQPLLDEAFAELARRWRPLLDLFDEQGVDVCYEIHPGEDLHDGVTFERFLARVDNHPRCNMLYDPSHLHLQQMDYLAYIDIYHSRIKAFHVKDAEFRRDGRSGVYGGYQPWQQRAGRFRSLGDGQIDFKTIFSKLTEYDFDGWAVLEWECCLKDARPARAKAASLSAAISSRSPDGRLMISPPARRGIMIQVGIIGRVYWPGASGGAAAGGRYRGGGAVRRRWRWRSRRRASSTWRTPTTALRRCWRIPGCRWCITVRRTICMRRLTGRSSPPGCTSFPKSRCA
jgi:hypothetical protein